jgi:hypothetical protein
MLQLYFFLQFLSSSKRAWLQKKQVSIGHCRTNQRLPNTSPGWIQILHLFSNTTQEHYPLACHSVVLPAVLLMSVIATRHCEFDDYIVVAIAGCWWWWWSSDLAPVFIIEFGCPINNNGEPIKFPFPPGPGPPSWALSLGWSSVAQCLPAPPIVQNVGERAKNARDKDGRHKRPCCVSWADKTQAVSCEQTRQGSILCLANTLTQGIQKQDHVDKPHGQKMYEKQHHVDKRYAHVDKRYAKNKGKSDQVSTR